MFATDYGTLNVPGVLVDDTRVTAGTTVEETSFETDTGGWSVPGAHPEGPAVNADDWIRSERIPFEDAAVTKSEFGLLFGFGFEGVNGQTARDDLMARTVGYLLED